jgi:DNA-binding transcriptional regulator YiaG
MIDRRRRTPERHATPGHEQHQRTDRDLQDERGDDDPGPDRTTVLRKRNADGNERGKPDEAAKDIGHENPSCKGGAEAYPEWVRRSHDIVTARLKCGLSQSQFAAALKISPRTLQQWEQGRRQPSGAAETLLKIVARHPEVLREVMAT